MQTFEERCHGQLGIVIDSLPFFHVLRRRRAAFGNLLFLLGGEIGRTRMPVGRMRRRLALLELVRGEFESLEKRLAKARRQKGRAELERSHALSVAAAVCSPLAHRVTIDETSDGAAHLFIERRRRNNAEMRKAVVVRLASVAENHSRPDRAIVLADRCDLFARLQKLIDFGEKARLQLLGELVDIGDERAVDALGEALSRAVACRHVLHDVFDYLVIVCALLLANPLLGVCRGRLVDERVVAG